MDADLRWIPFYLQTADALFPTGGYAHSLGFEEAVRLGMVRDEATLTGFLGSHISPLLHEVELPFLRFAYQAAQAGDIPRLAELDHRISAWKLARETREASLQIGGRRLRALRAICDPPLLRDYLEAVECGAALGHHLTVCGLQAVLAGVPLEAASAAYGYQTYAAVCAAALKLIRIGQDGVQRSLRSAARQLEGVLAAAGSVEEADAGTFSPLLDIASMRHARAHERLFIS